MPYFRRHMSGIPRKLPYAAVAGPLVLALTLGACAPGDPYGAPQFPFLSRYNAVEAAAPVLLSNTEWWRGFRDAQLDQLMAMALVQNLSIAAARERVIAARAASRSVADPLALNTTVQSRLADDGTTTQTQSAGELGLSWMLDPFGQRLAQQRAAWARIDAADAQADGARLLVLFNLGNAYVDLRYLQRLLELRRQEIGARRKMLSQIRQMAEAGNATQLDMTRAQARLSDVEAQIPTLEARIQGQINQIAVLTGHAPGQMALDLTHGNGQPVSAMSPDVGIPADLLRNRPDIRVAERLYYAAVAETGVAKAALYPRLSLSGAITLTALGNSTSHNSFFGPVLSLPVFPGRAARGRLDQAESEARVAHTAWKATVLDAVLEVENALLAYEASRRAGVSAARSLTLYRQARGMVEALVDSGDGTIDDLLDADQALTASANTLAEAARQRGLDFIALNVRLGSGSRTGAQTADADPDNN